MVVVVRSRLRFWFLLLSEKVGEVGSRGLLLFRLLIEFLGEEFARSVIGEDVLNFVLFEEGSHVGQFRPTTLAHGGQDIDSPHVRDLLEGVGDEDNRLV